MVKLESRVTIIRASKLDVAVLERKGHSGGFVFLTRRGEERIGRQTNCRLSYGVVFRRKLKSKKQKGTENPGEKSSNILIRISAHFLLNKAQSCTHTNHT